jgi:carboxylate-amine ligase
MGIPEYFENQAAYDAYLALLMRTGAIIRSSECWWGVRPAAKYPTLELRMTDACPRLDDTLCIASLFRLLVAHAIEQADAGAGYSPDSRWILKENRWRAKRDGLQAAFIIEGYDRPFSTEQWLMRAEQMLGDCARQLGVEEVFAQARRIIADGNSAQRQRAVYQQSISHGDPLEMALSAVVDHLLLEAAEPCEAILLCSRPPIFKELDASAPAL